MVQQQHLNAIYSCSNVATEIRRIPEHNINIRSAHVVRQGGARRGGCLRGKFLDAPCTTAVGLFFYFSSALYDTLRGVLFIFLLVEMRSIPRKRPPPPIRRGGLQLGTCGTGLLVPKPT